MDEFEKWWRSVDGDNYPFEKEKLCLRLWEFKEAENKEYKKICVELSAKIGKLESIIGSTVNAVQAEKKKCIKNIEAFFVTDDHGFLNVIKMGLIEYIRARGDDDTCRST